MTPRPENPSQRKRETHISLIHNATGKTVKTAKFPTPKQGTKNAQIGQAIVERQKALRNVNPLSKSWRVSKSHLETTPEELVNYIIENTEVKDKSKFKYIKLVKKDANQTTTM